MLKFLYLRVILLGLLQFTTVRIKYCFLSVSEYVFMFVHNKILVMFILLIQLVMGFFYIVLKTLEKACFILNFFRKIFLKYFLPKTLQEMRYVQQFHEYLKAVRVIVLEIVPVSRFYFGFVRGYKISLQRNFHPF